MSSRALNTGGEMSTPALPQSGKRPLAHVIQDALPAMANGKIKRRRMSVAKRAMNVRRDEIVFRILCHASKTGSVIGKGGSIIKAIRKDTGTMIRVEEAVPGCDERVVTISTKEDGSKTVKLTGQSKDEGVVLEEEREEEKVEDLSDLDKEARTDGAKNTAEEGNDVSQKGLEGEKGKDQDDNVKVKEEDEKEKEKFHEVEDEEKIGSSSNQDLELEKEGGDGKKEHYEEEDEKKEVRMEEDSTEGTHNVGEQKGEGEDDSKEPSDKEVSDKKAKMVVAEANESSLSPIQEALLRVHLRITEDETPKLQETNEKDSEGTICTRLLVPTSQVGCLLGKKGKIIQRMREESGAQIRVLPRDQLPRCAAPSDEVVQIMGDLIAVRKALLAASSQLQSNPPKEMDQEFGSLFAASGGRVQSAEMMSKSTGYMGQFVGPRPTVGRSHSPQHPMGQAAASHLLPASDIPFTGDVVFRILCPKEKIGSIIGKGGSIVQNLREETGARISIDVSSSEGDDRVVCISAFENPEDPFSRAQKALMIVHSKIIGSGPDRDGPMTTKLLVPADQAGCLIGKGGAIIIEMRKSTHAKIHIFGKEHLPPGSLANDELVQVVGNASVSQKALLQITSRLRGNLFQGKSGLALSADSKLFPRSQVGPHSESPTPRGIGMMPGIGSSGMYRSSFPDMPKVPPLGPPHGAWPPRQGFSGGPKGFSHFNSDAYRESARDFVRSTTTSLVTSKTVQVVVPERVMGSIIGENGGNLAQIREISGANVKIHVLSPGTSERTVEISGTPDQTHAAQSLLQAFILSGQ